MDELQTARNLGFESVEEFRAWIAAGAPTGRCSNENCYQLAFWPELEKPCIHCGYPINVTKYEQT